MALSVPEKIAQVAEHFARHNVHGYSQPNRGTGSVEYITLTDGTKVSVTNSDVDCSEMVRQCVNCALSGRFSSPIDYMWTGNEHSQLTAHGFVRIPYSASKVRRGDVLWVSGHTGVALGGGMQADAHGDEYGGITGPNRGDQTGHEVEVRSLRSWTYIYRYEGGEDEGEWFDVNKTYRFTKGSYVRTQPKKGSTYIVRSGGELVRYQKDDTVTLDGILVADGYIWGTYLGASGKRRYVAIGTSKVVDA